MDFTTLTEHFVLVVMVACLVVGYIIKHATFLNKIPNTDIPCILAVIGAILNGFVSGFSIESSTELLWDWLPLDCIRHLHSLLKERIIPRRIM